MDFFKETLYQKWYCIFIFFKLYCCSRMVPDVKKAYIHNCTFSTVNNLMKSFLIEAIQNKNVNEWNKISFFLCLYTFVCFLVTWIPPSGFIFLLKTFPFPFFFFNFVFFKEINTFHITRHVWDHPLKTSQSDSLEPNVKCQEAWRKW